MSFNKNGRFRHDSLQDKRSLSKILNAITDGIEGGKLRFSDDDNKIEMTPEDLLELKLTASQEDGRQRVNIRISWQEKEKKRRSKKPLKVSSQ
ncbi:MAG: amphi-Trp domain-containing protein [Gammaproteobacteria bacterium]|jgi:amphi-Trp domain-containing protein|nr:amphi-Trp domain-containing protein [Gammaproteobacteria bacterium]MBT4605936.1 amphi-Trp domain-containing protein [Thiotrichales bacterium]MBT3966813.1 amphi-Trp domain-containing protein [Gammaproteobacteria bacterium]MBT4811895.1 amphi-Trp domain-containing protein [Thiotrichales bacterium]MBT5362157.1 amphi-Trp domain-containing protein [Gammaproteobacteria bacterium]